MNIKANIILTHKCNLNCLHCYMDSGISDENHEVIYFDTLKMIDKLKNIGINNIMFTGGECMLFPKLKDIIKYSKNNAFTVGVFTNGMIYDTAIFDIIDYINISLDGDEKTHNYIRQNDKSFGNLIKVMEYLKKIDKPTNLQMTINDITKNSISFIEDFAVNYLNIRNIKLAFQTDKGRAKINKIKNNSKNIKMIIDNLNTFYEKTQYHIQITTNLINHYDFQQYFINEKPSFPLWIDMVDRKHYIFEDIKKFDNDKISIKELKQQYSKFHKILVTNQKEIQKEEYINIEESITKNYRG